MKEPKSKSFTFMFVTLGTILWIIVGVFAGLGHMTLGIVFSILAIISFVVAGICHYRKPTIKRVAPPIILGFREKEG